MSVARAPFRHAILVCLFLLGLTVMGSAVDDRSPAFNIYREAIGVISERSLAAAGPVTLVRESLDALFEHLSWSDSSYRPDGEDWATNDPFVVFRRAIVQISSRPGAHRTVDDLVYLALRGLLARRDKWAEFLTPEEYRAYRASFRSVYAGVGMDLVKERNSNYTCMPYPGSPAARAGIQRGDQLLAVDGVPVDGRSVFVIGSMVRGRIGEEVRLTVGSKVGFKRTLGILRETAESRSVFVEANMGGLLLHIYAFTPETPEEIADALREIPMGKTVTLNLEGCAGGDLDAAIKIARIFLPEDRPIVTVTRRSGSDKYRSQGAGSKAFTPVITLQDENTASAAEVLIAALTENNRASSLGKTSRGKGTVQDVISLESGGAIVLSTGRLYSPHGDSWDGVGLRPTRKPAPPAGNSQRSTGGDEDYPPRKTYRGILVPEGDR